MVENSWRQGILVPPEQVTVRLDLGWDSAHKVGMFAAEAFVPGTRELVAIEVHPPRTYLMMADWLGSAQRWQAEVVRAIFDPDPF
jgi:hypothetical protein